MAWKVVDIPGTGEGCKKELLRMWPRVPGEFAVWMRNGPEAFFPIKPPYNDVVRHPVSGKVLDRAPKGWHQYSLGTYADRDCALNNRRINARIAAYQTYVEVHANAGRLIQGTVKLDCAKEPSCPRANGVVGANVTAGGARATTGPGGHYLMKVKKGVHTVRADGGLLKMTTGPRRVDVRTRMTANADFKACGIRPPGAGGARLARAANVGGGKWTGGGSACLNYVEVTWRGSSRELTVTWASAPRCSDGIRDPEILVRNQLLRPGQFGHVLSVTPAEVGFTYPLSAPQLPNNVIGRLRADGSGLVTANLHRGDCTFGITDLKIKRG